MWRGDGVIELAQVRVPVHHELATRTSRVVLASELNHGRRDVHTDGVLEAFADWPRETADAASKVERSSRSERRIVLRQDPEQLRHVSTAGFEEFLDRPPTVLLRRVGEDAEHRIALAKEVPVLRQGPEAAQFHAR